MAEITEFQKLGEKTKSYFDQYCAIIEPYRKELWEYFDETVESESTDIDPIELHEAFEKLLQYLPPRQVAAVVLMDAFKFTAAETAQIIGTTEGAATALLHRAREKLKNMRNKNISHPTAKRSDHQLINQYVSCFNNRDFIGIAQLLADNAVFSFVTQNSKEYGRDTIMNASHHPDHYERSDIQAFVYELWGKQSVIFAKVSADGKPVELNEVLSFEVEDNKIIKINGYYFCPDFMEMAAEEIGLPREEWNWAD